MKSQLSQAAKLKAIEPSIKDTSNITFIIINISLWSALVVFACTWTCISGMKMIQ